MCLLRLTFCILLQGCARFLSISNASWSVSTCCTTGKMPPAPHRPSGLRICPAARYTRQTTRCRHAMHLTASDFFNMYCQAHSLRQPYSDRVHFTLDSTMTELATHFLGVFISGSSLGRDRPTHLSRCTTFFINQISQSGVSLADSARE